MAVIVPSSHPLGAPMPPTPHALTASMPTWESVRAWAAREPWIVESFVANYPRFFINPPLLELRKAILQRLHIKDDGEFTLLIFVNEPSATRCALFLTSKNESARPVEIVHFALPGDSEPSNIGAGWLDFHAVLYPITIDEEARAYWRDTGDGISTRHAFFCLDGMDFLQSRSSNPLFCTPNPETIKNGATPISLDTTGAAEAKSIRELIATLVTSERPVRITVRPEDVFLFPRGMSAIHAAHRVLASIEGPSEVVAFGFLYAETRHLVSYVNWDKYTHYGNGNAEELDELEASLVSGRRIRAFFCEFPGNPLLKTPDLERIGQLARKYDFIVACDETIGTFVNIDILSEVDIIMTSLSKMFSGACDVMGGSIVINPRSRHYDLIHSKLTAIHEDTFFPYDIATLHKNSLDFVSRVHASNQSGKMVAEYLAKQPSIVKIHYPSMNETAPLYEKYRRRDGGYGHLLSIIFREERSAIIFYDTIDVCKGTSFGTNFCLAIPYTRLAHYFELDRIETFGMSRKLIRLSIGLETPEEILKVVDRALQAVEQDLAK